MIGLIVSLVLVSLCQSAVLDLPDMPAGPRVYYPGVCEVADCRYGNCEIYNSTFYRCHCFKVNIERAFDATEKLFAILTLIGCDRTEMR